MWRSGVRVSTVTQLKEAGSPYVASKFFVITTYIEGLHQRDATSHSNVSMGWVDPRVWLGRVGNWLKICVFSGLGWVMGLK